MLYATPRRIFVLPYSSVSIETTCNGDKVATFETIGKTSKDGVNIYLKPIPEKGVVQVRAVTGNDGLRESKKYLDVVLIDNISIKESGFIVKQLQILLSGSGLIRFGSKDRNQLVRYKDSNRLSSPIYLYNLPFNKIEMVITNLKERGKDYVRLEVVKSSVNRQLLRAGVYYPYHKESGLITYNSLEAISLDEMGYSFGNIADKKFVNKLHKNYKEKIKAVYVAKPQTANKEKTATKKPATVKKSKPKGKTNACKKSCNGNNN